MGPKAVVKSKPWVYRVSTTCFRPSQPEMTSHVLRGRWSIDSHAFRLGPLESSVAVLHRFKWCRCRRHRQQAHVHWICLYVRHGSSRTSHLCSATSTGYGCLSGSSSSLPLSSTIVCVVQLRSSPGTRAALCGRHRLAKATTFYSVSQKSSPLP